MLIKQWRDRESEWERGGGGERGNERGSKSKREKEEEWVREIERGGGWGRGGDG